MDKPFIKLGDVYLNINEIAFISKYKNGRLRITMTIRRKDGGPYGFVVEDVTQCEQLESALIRFTNGSEVDAELKADFE